MTEAQDTQYPTECELCGAAAGEPCAEDCTITAQQATVDAYVAARKEREVPSEVQLYRALHQLPYSGAQPDLPMPAPGVDLNEWTAAIAEWIRGYAAWDRKEMLEAEKHRRRSISIDMQLGMIRTFVNEEILRGGSYGYVR